MEQVKHKSRVKTASEILKNRRKKKAAQTVPAEKLQAFDSGSEDIAAKVSPSNVQPAEMPLRLSEASDDDTPSTSGQENGGNEMPMPGKAKRKWEQSAEGVKTSQGSQSESGSDEDLSGSDGEEGANGAPAFARAFSRIMKKKVKESSSTGLILGDSQRKLAQERLKEEEQQAAQKEAVKLKKELKEIGHVLPSTHTDPKERALIRMATKGVVRLFNAVAKVQKEAAAAINPGKAAEGKGMSRAALIAELKGLAASSAGGASKTGIQAGTGTNEQEHHLQMGGEEEGDFSSSGSEGDVEDEDEQEPVSDSDF